MKLIESGIEMTQNELDEFKGGRPNCACGCDNYGSGNYHLMGVDGSGCYCDCGFGGQQYFSSLYFSADSYTG